MRLLCGLFFVFALTVFPARAHAFDPCILDNGVHLPCPIDITVTWNHDGTVTIAWTQIHDQVAQTQLWPYPPRIGDPSYVPYAIFKAPAPGHHQYIDPHPAIGRRYVIYEQYADDNIVSESVTPSTPLPPVLWLPLMA